MTTTTYSVSGMTCGHCTAAVTEELSKLSGVQKVSIDLNAGGIHLVPGHRTARVLALGASSRAVGTSSRAVAHAAHRLVAGLRCRVGCRDRVDRGAECERGGERQRQCTSERAEPDRDSPGHALASS